MLDAQFDFPLRLTLLCSNGGLFMSRGVGTHPNRVIDSFELIYVRRGTLSIEEMGHPFTVGPEETLILWPHRAHGGTAPYPPDLKFYWVHFTLTGSGPDTGEPVLEVPQHAHVTRPEQMTNLFRHLLSEQELLVSGRFR